MKSPINKGILIVLAMALMFTSCRSKRGNYQSVAGEVKVEVITLTESMTCSEREYIGVVEESNSVMLSFPAPGKIKNVYVREGQTVQEGQLLAETDPATLENMHATAAATLRQAEDAYQRMQQLYESNSLPEIQFIEIQTKLEQARASERIAARSLAESKLHAPQRGVVGARMMEPGMNVLPDQPVLTLLNTHKPLIKVAIPENEIYDTRTGQTARITVGALRNAQTAGKIVEKGVRAHPLSHSYDVKIAPDRDLSGLLPGMVCKVFISNITGEYSLVMPVNAVMPLEFGKGHFVWVVDQDNTVSRRSVTVGEIVSGGITIRKGVVPGDRIVISGFDRISDNIKVMVINE
ncbi:MAG TPA: efflux RND transporter periplasmic adaptor subunit [Bacteroidales bacterium]|nr:efflux RND transporter periplasmic adaptor subunit [Bacteroidales bacterium]